MELLVFWLLCAIVAAVIANAKGRSGFGWFLIGLLISVFAIILVAAMPAIRAEPVRAAPDPAMRTGDRRVLGPGVAARAEPDERRPCPECAELIMRQAKKCRFCGAVVTPLA